MRDLSLISREALIKELQRIQTSEEVLRTVTETAGIGLAIMGEDHRYRYTNQTYKTFLHLPPDDLAGRLMADVLGELYEQVIRARLERAFCGERVRDLLVPPAPPGEAERIYEVRLDSGTDRSGSFVTGVLIDVTKQKHTEEALRRYAERLGILHLIDRAILEVQSLEQVGMLVVNYVRRLVPCELATVLIYNAAADQLRVLGISSSAPSPLAPGKIIPIISGDPHLATWIRQPWHLADIPTLGFTGPHKLLEGPGVRSLLHIPLFTQGNFIGTLTLSSPKVGAFSQEHVEIAAEVVDQIALAIHNAQLVAQLQAERAELALRVQERTAALNAANAELAYAARLKDEFLASMSHELRTPLNSILGRAEILHQQIYGPLSDQQLNSLHAIEEGGRHLLDLINDILDLSKIEAGKIDLDLGPVSIADVSQASLRMVAQSALQKHISLVYPSEVPVEYLFADTRRLKQILVNLLSNAVKFTHEGGRAGLEILRDRELGLITFTVWDTGIGIAVADLPQLFKPFSQIDSSLSRQYGGSGLGLALVARLASLHGGSVTVESVPAQGSRFSVVLPWSDPDTSGAREAPLTVLSPSLPAQLSENVRRPLILLAEDNEVNIELLQDYLSATGYTVAVAHDGIEVIACAQELIPALILMDIQMPKMDGLEATRQLRANPATDAIPIVALTALAMRGDNERCIAAGANAYLSKPIDLRQLRTTIESLLHPGAVAP